MSGAVGVRTDGDNFASLRFERALVEFSKDGDSPACPNSWTWELWFDGSFIEGTSEEASLADSVADATRSIKGIVRELMEIEEYLQAYGAFGEETR